MLSIFDDDADDSVLSNTAAASTPVAHADALGLVFTAKEMLAVDAFKLDAAAKAKQRAAERAAGAVRASAVEARLRQRGGDNFIVIDDDDRAAAWMFLLLHDDACVTAAPAVAPPLDADAAAAAAAAGKNVDGGGALHSTRARQGSDPLDLHVIPRDVARTLPALPLFRRTETRASLQTVLALYCTS
jgi:hypothetical protein